MATIKKDGGYNALPISYKRGNPIPLDKSAVWYDKAEMEVYAASNPTAYVGQVLSYVNETDNKVEVYVIINEAGELELLNLAEIIGAAADVDNNIPATGLYAILDQKVDKNSVYTKDETDRKISELVVNATHLKRKIIDNTEGKSVDELIDQDAADALDYIYMIGTGLEVDDNKYDEYIVFETDAETRFIEKVGSWEVNLDDYVTQEEFSKIPRDGEKNVINSIDTTEFNINNNDGADRQLQIKEISHQKVAGLEELLNEKRNVSDKVPVADLSGLDTWLTNNGAALIQNIGVSNLSDELQAIIGNSTELKVNTDQFDFTNGVLNLKDAFVEVSLQDFQSTVGNLETMLKEGFNVYNEIKSIQDSLTWKDLNS